jgi:PAS domain S-box-containing protein
MGDRYGHKRPTQSEAGASLASSELRMSAGPRGTVFADSSSISPDPDGTLNFSSHTRAQETRYLLLLLVLIACACAAFPLLDTASYRGTADRHAMIETVGALIGLLAGLAFIIRFYVLGNRSHLFIGLAFFVNGAADLTHGFLSFFALEGWLGLSAPFFQQSIPGTYAAGRLVMALLLIAAPYAGRWFGESSNPRRETIWTSAIVLASTLAATALACQIPLYRSLYTDGPISRPVDLASAILFFAAFRVLLREYHLHRDILMWWVLLSTGLHAVGQAMMSSSGALFDFRFDIAHVYKVLGYLVALAGFTVYQMAIIRERRQAEAALRASEGNLAITLDSIGDGVIATDTRSRIVRMNPVAQRLTGWTLDEVRLRPMTEVFNVVAEGNDRGASNPVEEVLRTGRVANLANDTILISRDGSKHRVADSAAPIKEPDGTVVGVVLVFRDVTEAHAAELALRESEQRFRDISHSMADWVWEVDGQGRYTFASGQVKRVLGYDPDELVGRTPFELMPPDEAARVGAIVRRIFNAETPIVDLENWNLTKEGKRVCLLTNGVPIRGGTGEILGYRGVDKDITQRKRVEEALRVKDHAIASSINAICIADLEGRLTYINDAFLRMWECEDTAEILGRPIGEFFRHKPRTPGILGVLEDAGSWVGEAVIQRESGSLLEVQVSSNIVNNDDGSPICLMASFMDLSDRRRAEEALGHVKKLQGLIPICAHCHRIRDDEDAWQMMEVYIQEHSDALFSHGLCPECAEAYYPELKDREENDSTEAAPPKVSAKTGRSS